MASRRGYSHLKDIAATKAVDPHGHLASEGIIHFPTGKSSWEDVPEIQRNAFDNAYLPKLAALAQPDADGIAKVNAKLDVGTDATGRKNTNEILAHERLETMRAHTEAKLSELSGHKVKVNFVNPNEDLKSNAHQALEHAHLAKGPHHHDATKRFGAAGAIDKIPVTTDVMTKIDNGTAGDFYVGLTSDAALSTNGAARFDNVSLRINKDKDGSYSVSRVQTKPDGAGASVQTIRGYSASDVHVLMSAIGEPGSAYRDLKTDNDKKYSNIAENRINLSNELDAYAKAGIGDARVASLLDRARDKDNLVHVSDQLSFNRGDPLYVGSERKEFYSVTFNSDKGPIRAYASMDQMASLLKSATADNADLGKLATQVQGIKDGMDARAQSELYRQGPVGTSWALSGETKDPHTTLNLTKTLDGNLVQGKKDGQWAKGVVGATLPNSYVDDLTAQKIIHTSLQGTAPIGNLMTTVNGVITDFQKGATIPVDGGKNAFAYETKNGVTTVSHGAYNADSNTWKAQPVQAKYSPDDLPKIIGKIRGDANAQKSLLADITAKSTPSVTGQTMKAPASKGMLAFTGHP